MYPTTYNYNLLPPGVNGSINYNTDDYEQDEMFESFDSEIQFISSDEKDMINEYGFIITELISTGEDRLVMIPEMVDEMDIFETRRNQVENFHSLISSTPYVRSKRSVEGELDIKNRTIITATLQTKGLNYATFNSSIGKIYVKPQFFNHKKFPKDTEKTVRMIVALQDAEKLIRWTCIKIL